MIRKTLLFALSMSSLALAAPGTAASSQVKRGEYLVSFGGCHDCHTPKKMGALQGPWMAATVGTMTAWAGPWGISYTANLTPDRETGLGAWTEQNFVDTMRTGRHMGRGRPILPPMPWEMVGKLTDQDLKAVFAYLRTIPAVKNRVPQPVPPAAPATASAAPPAQAK